MDDRSTRAVIEGELRQSVPAAVRAIAETIRQRHGAAVAACLFYGSCLRDGVVEGRVADFYTIVDSYRAFHGRGLSALLNALLPPNVYYAECAQAAQVLRAKYAVISLDHLTRHTSAAAFQPTLWGRLAQPCALVYARDEEVERRVAGALAGAARTLIEETVPLLPAEFTARDLWVRALSESYRTELRAERTNRPRDLYESLPGRYDDIAQTVLEPLRVQSGGPGPGTAAEPLFRHEPQSADRRRASLRWRLRRLAGKVLHVMRLAKAAYTFAGGLDYILWKIETHSGVRADPTPWQRRHPLVAAPGLAWRLYRRGAFR